MSSDNLRMSPYGTLFVACPTCGNPMALMRGYALVDGELRATIREERCFVCYPPAMKPRGDA